MQSTKNFKIEKTVFVKQYRVPVSLLMPAAQLSVSEAEQLAEQHGYNSKNQIKKTPCGQYYQFMLKRIRGIEGAERITIDSPFIQGAKEVLVCYKQQHSRKYVMSQAADSDGLEQFSQ